MIPPPEETYNNWRTTLHKPDDSLFYYHPSLERILLGLSIFVLTPQPAFTKLGNVRQLRILHTQVPSLITAWIDEDNATFSRAIACGGDMSPALADELLDDLTTNGREISSDKIKAFGTKVLALTREYGFDIPLSKMNEVNGWG
jgi:hypothetical protein